MADTSGNAEYRVQRQIERRGVRDARVLAAMLKVERSRFLPEAMQAFADEDSALPIEEGQTNSQPYIVARMAEAARVGLGDRVLEIGAGSGYAAAILAELAGPEGRVFAVERHGALAELARHRLKAAGASAVVVRTGDGTLGWLSEAPFDAIVVSAGGPRVPDALRSQLAIGGRLVMPVGARRDRQQLLRLTRSGPGPEAFEEERLDHVQFVPLIGAEAWSETAPEPDAEAEAEAEPSHEAPGLPALIRAAAHELPHIDDPAFAGSFNRFAECRVVLLGEASHGTAEFYRARAAITRRLIERHGFSAVAVEADWPDAAAIDRHVRRASRLTGGPSPVPGKISAFRRFPTWMWRNVEVDEFVEWLRAHNAGVGDGEQAGFYGLDIYSLSESIGAVLAYLDRTDPATARVARERYGCLTPWQRNPETYGRAVLSQRYRVCEPEVVAALTDLLKQRLDHAGRADDRFFDAVQNARLVAAAERYYRIMYYGGAESWNLRDTHMFETLMRLLEHRGPESKIVVWAHNSHIGDARFTDMGRRRDELNLGQLCRERLGDRLGTIGFGTHTGTVAAAHDWGEPMQVMKVNPSLPDSIERQFHESGLGRGVLMTGDAGPRLHERLLEERLERFIGVIYRPHTELQSHYAAVELPGQFDAYVWFDRTTALEALPAETRPGVPDTYPFGV